MTLDELHAAVTDAIIDAESHPPDSLERRQRFRCISDLEEEIAAIAGAQTVAGEAARLGAITAALSAGEPLRALQLAARYSGVETLSLGVHEEMSELVERAEAQLRRNMDDEPWVQPVRFRVKEAA